MQMRMEVKILSPGMKNGEKADVGAEMFRVASNGKQSFGGGPEENVENRFRVVESDSRNLFGQREDDVKILDGQQFGLSGCEPFGAGKRLAFGGMPVSTRVVADADMTALAAFVEVLTKGRCTARGNGVEYPALLTRQGVRSREAGISKNVGQFENWLGHGGS